MKRETEENLREAQMEEQETRENLRKEQMEEGWDSDTVDALRGYAPLSYDATTAEELEWKHLKHENNQELLERLDTSRDHSDLESNPNAVPPSPSSSADSYIPSQRQHALPISSSAEPIVVNYGPEGTRASKSQPNKRLAGHERPVPQRAAQPGTDRLHNLKNDDALKDALIEVESLRIENERLRQSACQASVPNQPSYSSKVFYRIGSVLYLDEPRWEPTEGYGVRLLANNPIRRLEYYLDHHPEIAFAIYKDYEQDVLQDSREIETADGIYRSPTPTHEILSLISPHMQDAVEELIQQIPRFDYYFPHFRLHQDIPAPYLFMYYSTPFIPKVLPKLGTRCQNLIKQLQTAIAKSYGHEYTSAKLQAEKGMITRKHLKYLIRPGDVLVSSASEGNIPQACIATGWIEAKETILDNHEYEKWEHSQTSLIEGHDPLANPTSSRKMTTYVWKVPVWNWSFNGTFARHETMTNIMMSLAHEGDSIEIRSLNKYPLQYAAAEIRPVLEKRGRTFWSLRSRRYVSYMRPEEDEPYNIEDRYMVDTKTYKMLVPDSEIAKLRLKNGLSAAVMARDHPPGGCDTLLVFPDTIKARHLQENIWKDLLVDRVTEIKWNKQAFKDLVAERETKELVQALVMKQISVGRSTDFVAGKGTGLIMLLHGAPGTGKTFTAEGVAEFAEKPLLRITCGDIGTEPEVVDQRLRATLQLGKLWDCGPQEKCSGIRVSPYSGVLRWHLDPNLESRRYMYVISTELSPALTTRCVVDEAFKSRIQLALHYDNLGIVQRKKIWRNFIKRMETLEESSSADLEDILDHIDELSKEPMNGREIRNAITIARQLAQFREERFHYSHLKHAMSVGSRFSKYLKDLRMNYTDDMIKQDSGIRYSYTAAPAGLE
ncbi:hypothetical protein IG631_00108 [Alternaria alternata]|nr:hypothetical protein IG631_00108 [Alternaria alternata]